MNFRIGSGIVLTTSALCHKKWLENLGRNDNFQLLGCDLNSRALTSTMMMLADSELSAHLYESDLF